MSDKAQTLAIVGYGMWTAAGHDGPSSAAAIQAGVGGAQEALLWDPTAGARMEAFKVNGHQWWEGETFLPELAHEAIRQCHAQLEELGAGDPKTVPILIAVAPQDRPARTDKLESLLIEGLEARLGFDLPEGSGVIPEGRCGIATLLANAQAQLQKHPVQILVGVESLLRQAIVRHYIDENRLLCAINSSGFIPGEAAAALIVAPIGSTGLPELLIKGIGQGHEPLPEKAADTSQAAVSGLTKAIRQALKMAKTEMYDISVALTDLNGEHSKFKEMTVAHMRLDRLPPEDETRRPTGTIEHWNVAEAIGEVGAALIPAALGTAWEAGKAGILPSKTVLLHAGEDDGTRIAIVAESA